MQKLAVLFLLTLLVGFSVPAWACFCEELAEVPEALDQADAVFAGTVIAIEEPEESPWLKVTIQVSTTWKGVSTPTTVVYDSPLTRCRVGFEEGESYLVYAVAGTEPGNPLQTSTCTRTRALAEATEDLEALGPGQPV